MGERISATPQKGKTMRDVLFTLLGIVLAASLNYFFGLDTGRLNKLREIRSDRYTAFMKAQIKLELPDDTDAYTKDTAQVRKDIAIYGSKTVVQALANYWRRPEFGRKQCDGSQEKNKDDIRIYQAMRNDTSSWLDKVSDADMMMLLFLCKVDF